MNQSKCYLAHRRNCSIQVSLETVCWIQVKEVIIKKDREAGKVMGRNIQIHMEHLIYMLEILINMLPLNKLKIMKIPLLDKELKVYCLIVLRLNIKYKSN